MPGNPGVTIVIRRHEEMRKNQLKIEQAKKIRSTGKKKQQKEFDRKRKINETKGQALFAENDFALAIHFFHLSENWVMKKNAFEKLKFEIQEKLNDIPIPSDTIQ